MRIIKDVNYTIFYIIIIDNIIVAPFTRFFFVCVEYSLTTFFYVRMNFVYQNNGLAFYRHKTELHQALPGSRFYLQFIESEIFDFVR